MLFSLKSNSRNELIPLEVYGLLSASSWHKGAPFPSNYSMKIVDSLYLLGSLVVRTDFPVLDSEFTEWLSSDEWRGLLVQGSKMLFLISNGFG